MRHSARSERDVSTSPEMENEVSEPVSTVENPLMEELHTVSSSSVPAWKTPSVVVSPEKKDPFKSSNMFVSIDEEYQSTDSRPMAPVNATIVKEKEVKEHFSVSPLSSTSRWFDLLDQFLAHVKMQLKKA